MVARFRSGGNVSPHSLLFSFFYCSTESVREKTLSREVVARTLKARAAQAGIPEARVSCHSLRSGGATAMLRCSQSYEDTRCFFRWRSDVARVYLRSVRGAMRNVSCLMAAGSGMDSVILAGN
jgi:integrase